MNKKLFTILLLTVFMLSQFSSASAVTVPGTASITNIPNFSNGVSVDIDWAATGVSAPIYNILIWGKEQITPPVTWLPTDCFVAATAVGTSTASGTYTYVFTVPPVNGTVWDFTVTLDDQHCATADLPKLPSTISVVGSDATAPSAALVMGSTTIDSLPLVGFAANPPTLDVVGGFDSHRVSCNTFEMWALVSDNYGLPDTVAYSGFNSWNQTVTTKLSAASVLVEPALPSYPQGPNWAKFYVDWIWYPGMTHPIFIKIFPVDFAGNPVNPLFDYFRYGMVPNSDELDDCKPFTDTVEHVNETHIRYLGDLDLIAGNPDGSFGPDTTLTRAEASTLIEKANGYDDTMLPVAPPSAACTFTDVSASDWFAGWVWQACSDGFMNGLGGGLFGPADLLTRGQIVTILNNVALKEPGPKHGYLEDDCIGGYCTVINDKWGWELRIAAFTDISIGAFYTIPIQNAYGVGVAEGTSDTTFSPDQPVLRGEFAEMLYRALSRTN